MKNERREYAELRRAAAEAAERDAKTKAAPEMVRAHMWHVLPVAARRRALHLAGVDVARAGEELAQLSDGERRKIRAAVERHMMEMSVLIQCMRAYGSDEFGLSH